MTSPAVTLARKVPTCGMCEMRPVLENWRKRKGELVLYFRSMCRECANAGKALEWYWRDMGMPISSDKTRAWRTKWLHSYPAGVRSAKDRSVPEWRSRVNRSVA